MNTTLRRAAGLIVWVVQAGMAVAMVGPGVQKFTGHMWRRMFDVWGYPDGFYLVIGTVEVCAGIALLVPRLATTAALLLMVVMVGAGITQLTHGRDGIGEGVFLCALAVIAYARWPGILRGRVRATPTELRA